MIKLDRTVNHNIIKLFEKADIQFPLSKKELLEKAGDYDIKINSEETIKFSELLLLGGVDYYSNRAQFFCFISSLTVNLKEL